MPSHPMSHIIDIIAKLEAIEILLGEIISDEHYKKYRHTHPWLTAPGRDYKADTYHSMLHEVDAFAFDLISAFEDDIDAASPAPDASSARS